MYDVCIGHLVHFALKSTEYTREQAGTNAMPPLGFVVRRPSLDFSPLHPYIPHSFAS